MKKFLQRHSQVKKYAFILLIAIEFLMSFTFLGYIHIPPISITFAYIPILVAGCFLGIGQATFLGLLFGLASMYKRQCVEHAEPIRIKLDTVDHYCEERNIPRINLLKIDIEGNELNALHGAQRMLDEGKIDVIQMEFGGCNIDSRTYFRDFWNLLSAKYKVYRVLLDGVEEITEYGDILEIFFCTNYLFVRK